MQTIHKGKNDKKKAATTFFFHELLSLRKFPCTEICRRRSTASVWWQNSWYMSADKCECVVDLRKCEDLELVQTLAWYHFFIVFETQQWNVKRDRFLSYLAPVFPNDKMSNKWNVHHNFRVMVGLLLCHPVQNMTTYIHFSTS